MHVLQNLLIANCPAKTCLSHDTCAKLARAGTLQDSETEWLWLPHLLAISPQAVTTVESCRDAGPILSKLRDLPVQVAHQAPRGRYPSCRDRPMQCMLLDCCYFVEKELMFHCFTVKMQDYCSKHLNTSLSHPQRNRHFCWASDLARRAKRFFWSKVTSPRSICG